jgi:hypothetical protein
MDVIVIDRHRRSEAVQATIVWSESFSGASLDCLFAASLLRNQANNDYEISFGHCCHFRLLQQSPIACHLSASNAYL